jgi:hypothetical protein
MFHSGQAHDAMTAKGVRQQASKQASCSGGSAHQGSTVECSTSISMLSVRDMQGTCAPEPLWSWGMG